MLPWGMYDIFARMIQVLTAFPSVTRRGLVALFNLTGRFWLLIHDSVTWYACFGFGAATLYVSTTGTDSPEKGTGTGTNAFLTVQYAINQIPATLFGSVTLNIGAGTYREAVTIQGKSLAGNYSLTLTGAETTDLAATAFNSAANGAGNGSAGFGTITKTAAGWTVNAYQNKYVAIEGTGTGNGQTYLVHSNTADTITVVGPWATVPGAASNTLRVWSHGTRITGANAGAETTAVRQHAIRVRAGQRGVVLTKLQIDYAGLGTDRQAPVLVLEGSACDVTYCRLEGGQPWNAQVADGSRALFEYCLSTLALTAGLLCDTSAAITAARFCRIVNEFTGVFARHGGTILELRATHLGSCTNVAVVSQHGGSIVTDAYLDVDASASDNVYASQNGRVAADSQYGAPSTVAIKNAGGWGFRAVTGGYGDIVQAFTYSGNTSGTFTPATAPDSGTT